MKKFRSVHALLVAAFLPVVAILLWVGGDVNSRDEYHADPDKKIVRVLLSGKKFDIPLRYMYGEAIEKRKHWPDVKDNRVSVDAFSLSLLLPDLRPYYSEDYAKWKVKGHGDRVEVSVKKPVGGEDWFQKFKSKYMERSVSGDVVRAPEENGLIHFSSLFDQYFPVSESLELNIRCDKERREGFFPSCKVRSNYGPGIVLEYYYGINHLERWREIDQGLKAALDDFSETGEQGY